MSARYHLLLFIFVISGFTGLIYESIWSHYLKLFLGHAAYSQALVLAIFMGGMAIGAWLSGILVTRAVNLLLCYALVEFIIGLSGIGFHDLFRLTLDVSFNRVIPELASPSLVLAYKWITGSILILPQSILLGMTFPLMSNGLLRMCRDIPGRTIAWLYFANSIGAAVGVLIAGFYLISRFGMPGTVFTAGLINVLIALSVYLLSKGRVPAPPVQHATVERKLPRIILWAAFLTGTASFIYELVWIRMLSMVIGASTHSFEILLSTFIAGLAFGSLWIRNRIDRFRSPIYFAAIVQLLMAILAVGTLLLYSHTFDFMSYLLDSLKRNDSGYSLFLLGSYGISMLIMFPAAFMAGMTLPLLSLALIQNNYGDKSISHIYVANMLGAICGVVFTLLAGFQIFGIKGSLLIGSGIDLLLGLFLLSVSVTDRKRGMAVAATAICVFMVIGLVSELDVRRMASGVFRYGTATQPPGTSIRFHQDGRTASISIVKYRDGKQILMTNGKPDASVYRDVTAKDRSFGDEITQSLLGALPLAIYPEATDVAVIGVGSGMTVHTLLASPQVKRVDSIEIEAEVINAARHFLPRNDRFFTDNRNNIYIEDAKTFFSLRDAEYDLVIAEPSNPWVSGVSSLYTDEFYRRIRSSIRPDGYLVQWLHLYELSNNLFLSVLEALSRNFDDYAIYATNSWDIIIIAKPDGRVKEPGDFIFANNTLARELSAVGINGPDDIKARFLADRRLLEPVLQTSEASVNSDYYPILDLNAAKSRFVNDQVTLLTELRTNTLPLSKLFYPGFVPDAANVTREESFRYSNLNHQAYLIYQAITGMDDAAAAERLSLSFRMHIENLMNTARQCEMKINDRIRGQGIYRIVSATLPYLDNGKIREMIPHLISSCEAGQLQEAWVQMLGAITAGDFDAVVHHAGALLDDSMEFSVEYRQYLFSLKLLAHFLQGENRQFSETMSNYYRKLFKSGNPPVPVDIMLRHVGMRTAGPATSELPPRSPGRQEHRTSHFDAVR